MSTTASLQNTATKSPSSSGMPHSSLLLQRKCACGSPKSSLTGACAECQGKNRLQSKLTIGASNDPLELEADRVADQVLAAPANPAAGRVAPHIQRYTGQATADAGNAPASVDRVIASSGRPLDQALQQDLGQRFGHDFSQVRVHTGTAAEQSAREVNAHAYTVGHNIVFGAGRFTPKTHDGRKLLAHELTHVVQQGKGISTKKIQRSWDWGRAGAGALIGGAGGALLGGLIGGPIGAAVGAGVGALAGGLIGGLSGSSQPPCAGGSKTIAVDFVRLHGATLSPATELAAANTIFSSCCIRFTNGAMPPQESEATTKSWLGGDTDVNASGITCSATTVEEKKMYDEATRIHSLSSRMRVFLVDTFSGYGAAGFSRPPYCAGGGYANHVILSNSASGATNPLAHEFGHILQNNGVHSTPPNLMAPSGGTVLDPAQCATCYANA